MPTVHVLIHACPAHWRLTASPTVSLRFLLSLNSRGTTTRRAASAERGGRTAVRPIIKKKSFGSTCHAMVVCSMRVEWISFLLCLFAPEPVLRRRRGAADGSIEQKQQQQRQTHNAPGVNGGRETIPTRGLAEELQSRIWAVFFPEHFLEWHFSGLRLIYWLDWDNIDFATRASGLISKLSHDVSGEIPKGQGDSGRIWNSSQR